MALVNLILQGKGGVGKTFIATLLAEHYKAHNIETVCVDTDPVNATFASFPAYGVRRLKILDGDNIDPEKFDELVEIVVSAPEGSAVIVDNGAATFVPLCASLMDDGIVPLLKEKGHEVVLHTVVAGGDMMEDTLRGLIDMCENFPDVNVVVWRNEHFGPVRGADGTKFEDFKACRKNGEQIKASIVLAACGGDGGDDPVTTMPDPPPDPGPTPYEAAKAAIAAAATAEAAQAAYDGALGSVTGAEAAQLQTALDTRLAELATMARAEMQRMDLMAAAGMIDTSNLATAAEIAAANTAIAALKGALAAATDVSDTDKAMYQGQVDAAETAVAAAQSALDHAAQTMALMDAVTALQAIDLGDLTTQDKIDAAEEAIAAVRMALDAATELSAAEKAAAMTELATANRTVMMAQGGIDLDGQKMVLSDAVSALEAIDLDNLMTQAQIDAAEEAIIALDLALEAATDLTAAEKLDATVDVTVAKRKVEAARTVLANNIDSQRTALGEAALALGQVDLADLSDQAKIDAAQEAVDALKAALDAATHLSDSEKEMYRLQLGNAEETVTTARTGMDRNERMTAQRTAIMNAVTMARTAVAGVNDDSTDTAVAAADSAIAALKAAIEGAEDLPEGDADVAMAMGTLDTLEPQLAAAKRSRTVAMEAAAEEERKAMAAAGKALHGALGSTPLGNLDRGTNTGGAALVADGGLTVDQVQGSLTADPAAVMLEAGDSAGALGSWNGTHYANINAGTKVANTAVVYTNQGAPTSVSFADAGHTVDRTRALRASLHHRAFNLLGFSPQVALVREVRKTNAQLYDYKRFGGELRFVRQF